MKEEEKLKGPHIRFFVKKIFVNDTSVLTKEQYEELHSYEPMMYRLENLERVISSQQKEHDRIQSILNKDGFHTSIDKCAYVNFDDYKERRTQIEDDSFIGWVKKSDVQWVGDEVFEII